MSKKLNQRIQRTVKLILALSMIVSLMFLGTQNRRNKIYAASHLTLSADQICGSTLGEGTYTISGSTNYTADDGENALKIDENSIVTLILNGGTIELHGGNASGPDIPGAAAIHLPESSSLHIKGSGKLIAYGGNAANGENGANGQGRDISDSFSSTAKPGRGGHGGAGAGAGIGGNGAIGGGGNAPGLDGRSVTETCGSVMIFDTVVVEAYGGLGGAGGNGGTGGRSYAGSIAIYTVALAGAGGGGGGGGGFPAAGIGSGGAGGGAGGNGEKGENWQVPIISMSFGKATCGVGGGGGAGYGSGAGGSTGRSAGTYAFVGIVYDSTNSPSQAGGTPGTLGTPGDDGGTVGVGERPTAGSHETGGVTGRGVKNTGDSGKNINGALDIYVSVDAKVIAKHGGAEGQTSMNAVDLGSGGGVGTTTKTTTFPIYNLASRSIKSYVNPSSYTYDGAVNKPTVSVKYNTKELPAKSYSLKFDDELINVGKKKIVITGKDDPSTGAYVYGETDVSYEITQAKLKPVLNATLNSIELGQTVNIFVNENHDNTVTWHKTEESIDFDIEELTNGSAVLTPKSTGTIELYADVAGDETYLPSQTNTLKIVVMAQGISNFIVDGVEDKVYTGEDIIQDSIKVSYEGQVLQAGTDYDISYSDNVAVGTALITIKGKGERTGTIYKSFQITPMDISQASLSQPKNLTYTSQAQFSPVDVIYKGETLTEGIDYKLFYSESVNAGQVEVTVMGMNNFMNSTSTHYQILPKPISNDNSRIQVTGNYTYNGAPQKATLGVFHDDILLNSQNDYDVTYNNNTNAGEADIIVKAKGNYTGTLTSSFMIDKKDLYINASGDLWKYKGGTDPELTFTYSGNVEGDIPTFDPDTSLKRDEGETLGLYVIRLGDLTFADDNPVNKNYQLKINNYSTFEIKNYVSPYDATLEGEMGKNDWYISRVKIVAPSGYKIATTDSEETEWLDSISYDDGDFSVNGAFYYLQEISTGYISEYKTIQYKQDTHGAQSRIIINKSKAWTGMYPTPTFDKTFFNEDANIGIYGDDELSGIDKVHYYMTSQILDEDALKSVTDDNWIEISNDEEAVQSDTNKHIVYVKMEDKAGNISYGRSDGFIIDRVKPTITYVYDLENTWTSQSDISISTNITDDTAGLKDRYVDYSIDGQDTQLIKLDEDGNGVINFLPDGDYIVKIKAVDNAGNEQTQDVHVKKDTFIPTIASSGDTETYATKQKVDLNIKTGASGVDKVYVQYVANGDEFNSNGTWEDITDEYNDTGGYVAHQNGNYYFKVKSVVGLESDVTNIGFSRIDNTQPVVNYQMKKADMSHYDNNSWTNQSINVLFTNGANNLGTSLYEYSVDNGVTWQKLELEDGYAHVLFEDNGIVNVQMRITSHAGVVSDLTTLTVKIDKVNPYGKIGIGENKWRYVLKTLTGQLFYKDTMDLTIDPSDELSGIAKTQYFLLSGQKDILNHPPQSINEVEHLASINGGWVDGELYHFPPNNQYNVGYAKITDKAGNVCYLSTDGFVLDNIAPDISIVENHITDFGVVGQWFDNDDASLSVYVNDELSGVDFDSLTYQIENEEIIHPEIINSGFVVDHLKDGEYNITFEAMDIAGNKQKKLIKVKKDTQEPTVNVIADTKNYAVTVDSQIEVTTGIAGLLKVEKQFVLENQKLDATKWVDITSTYQNNEVLNKKGTYYVRVTDNLLREKTIAVVFDKIQYVEAKIQAWKENSKGEKVDDDAWINPQGAICFANNPANVRGFTYQYREQGTDNWNTVTPDEDGVARFQAYEGQHTYELRVSNGRENSDTTITAKADNTLPSGKLIFSTIHPDSDDLTIIETISQSSDIVTPNSIQHFFSSTTNKAIILGDVEDNTDGSGIDQISYFIDRSDSGAYLTNYPDNAQDIEKMIQEAGGWDTTLSYDKWLKTLDGGNQAQLPVGLRMNRSHVVYVKITDQAGNARYITTDGFAFDNRKPEIQTDYAQASWLNTQSAGVRVSLVNSIGGLAEASYTINGHSYTVNSLEIINHSFLIPFNQFEDGENTLTIHAKNKLGIDADEKIITVKVETDAPKISVSGNTNRYSLDELVSIDVTPSTSGIKDVEVKKDQGEYINITEAYKDGYKVEVNGTYTFRTISHAGNISNEASLTFDKIDSEPPIPEIETFEKKEEDILDSYTPDTWTANDVEITISNAQDNYGISKVEYRIDNPKAKSLDTEWQELGELKDTNEAQSLTLQDPGEHPVFFRIRTQLGRTSAEKEVPVLIDKESPELKLSIIDENWKNDKATVQIEAKDTLSGVDGDAYSFDDGQTFTNHNTLDVNQNGTLSVVVKDTAGNISKETIKVSNIDKLAPQISQSSMSITNWAKSKNVSATIIDSEATQENGMSGINYAFLTSHNPYSGKTITRTEPQDDDILMRNYGTSQVFTTSQSITKYIGEVEEDNYYIVAMDEAGNVSATSLCVNKIDGIKSPTTKPDDNSQEKPADKPSSTPTDKPEQNGSHSKPSESDNPNLGDQSEDSNYTDVVEDANDIINGNQSSSDVNDEMSSEEKNTITDILDKIEKLLNGEGLTEEERQTLLVKKTELIEKLVTSLIKDSPTDQKAIQENIEYIDRLLARNDLTEEQRTQLIEKQKELQKKMNSTNDDISLYIVIILGIILLSGAGLYSYQRKKKFEKEIQDK